MRSLFGCSITVLLVLLLGLARGVAETCVGDCNGDQSVLVNELITAVNVALGVTPLDACPGLDCPGQPPAAGITCLIQAVRNALNGCPGASPTPLQCQGCDANGSCSGEISGVQYIGTCGDGEIINGTCYRTCNWEVPPDLCGGAACASGHTCLTTWNGLVVAGRCTDCDCVPAIPPTRTATPTPGTGTPPATPPAHTVPSSLERAIDLTCYGHSEREFEADDARFSGTCSGGEYGFSAEMRQFGSPAAALQALDTYRGRGVAVPFRGGDAITWTESYEEQRTVYYVWASGCWLVEIADEMDTGSGHPISPLRLAEPLYVFATTDGLFDQCLTASP